MTDKLVIFYFVGSYGSWLEWMIQYCHSGSHEHTRESPLNEDGSSHNHSRFIEHSLAHPIGDASIIESVRYVLDLDDEKIPLITVRAIPQVNKDEPAASIINRVATELDCLYINPGNDRMRELALLNLDKKAQPITDILSGEDVSIMHRWNPAARSLDDLEPWQIREWLSVYYHDTFIHLSAPLDERVLQIDLQDILHGDVEKTVRAIFDHFRLPLREESLAHVRLEHQKMLSLQSSLEELDAIDLALDAIEQSLDVPIPQLSLLAQAMMQKKLRDRGYDIRCYGLNEWPASTADLHKLLVL